MKELDYLKIIHETLTDNSFLGDDCAFLQESGLYLTQDTLVENVHFRLSTTSAYDLGYKSIAVNLSDLAAAASEPLYVSISLSLPHYAGGEFVRAFYSGVDDICNKYNVKVTGGDLTGGSSIVISVCAIGKKISKYNVSRSNAQIGDIVFVTGGHGESAAALKLFYADKENEFAKKHLCPEPKIEEGKILAVCADSDFALMDSSDGLGDALFKIANESNASIEADFDSIPYNSALKNYFPEEFKELIFWGGEDFELVGAVNGEFFKKLPPEKFFPIGKVVEKTGNSSVIINFGNSKTVIDEKTLGERSFNHFK